MDEYMSDDLTFDDSIRTCSFNSSISLPNAQSSWNDRSPAFENFRSFNERTTNKYYGLIMVKRQNPSDKPSLAPLLDVKDHLEELLQFFCHDEDHLQHMRKELVTFWHLEESTAKSCGAQYLDSDIPQLRMKAYNEECIVIQQNKNMTKSNARLARNFQWNLNLLLSLKLDVCEIRKPGNMAMSLPRRALMVEQLHKRLCCLLMNMLYSFYEVDISDHGTDYYIFKSRGYEIFTRPDLVVPECVTDVIIQVCSVLENTSVMNKSGDRSSQASDPTKDISPNKSGDRSSQASDPTKDISPNKSGDRSSQASDPSNGISPNSNTSQKKKSTDFEYTGSAYTKVKEWLKSIPNKIQDDHNRKPAVVLRNNSESPKVSETQEDSTTKDEKAFYLHQINSRELPDVLKNMSFNYVQIEIIFRQLYGLIINNLMGCVSEAFSNWHTGPNKDKVYVEVKGKRLLNEVWGFFVIHEIAIPVKLYCPTSFIVTSLFKHETKYIEQYYPGAIDFPIYTVMNWYIDLSKQAGRRSLACFLKYNQAHHFQKK